MISSIEFGVSISFLFLNKFDNDTENQKLNNRSAYDVTILPSFRLAAPLVFDTCESWRTGVSEKKSIFYRNFLVFLKCLTRKYIF